ncbi:MAG: sodium:solute symporter [Actinomycetota bacterium]|nr:sodium:solute symporter [Actinomycetota bacterium]
MPVRPAELAVFAVLFVAIATIGFLASRWRRGNLDEIEEWGLAGGRFGGFVTWFLQGGSIYTTYSFVAVPALVYGQGTLGFYALPYLVVSYLVIFLVMPRLWSQARAGGHVTAADYVQARFSSRPLSTTVAITGIASMVPYVALQVYGIEMCLHEIGFPVEASLFIAFCVLAGITYVSGLRAAALISMAKDVLIWTTVLVAVVYIPIRLGGYHHIFASVPRSKLDLSPALYGGFTTLAIGSGLALPLYPHTFTGSLSASNARVVRSNAVTLPIYTIMLGMLALLGYMGIVAGIHPDPHYGANIVVPALFQKLFPAAFAGFALAAISIGALVPASVMSIAAGNLFARNVFRPLKPDASPKQQTRASKVASLVLKFLAVGFIVLVPTTFVINFQLAGGVWIVQVLPAVFLAPALRFLDHRAVLAGLLAGLAWGTGMLAAHHFSSSLAPLGFLGINDPIYIGVPALALNTVVALGGSVLLGLRRAGALAPRLVVED